MARLNTAVLIASLSLLFNTVGHAAESVVLGPDHIDIAKHQCARAVPQGVESTWLVPDPAAIDVEVRHLPSISVGNATIRMPFTSARQYLGVVIDGKKLVYINAFPANMMKPIYRYVAVTACGGGSDYWGALYDPETRHFSQFEVNSPTSRN